MVPFILFGYFYSEKKLKQYYQYLLKSTMEMNFWILLQNRLGNCSMSSRSTPSSNMITLVVISPICGVCSL